ncbi:MAG TPA: hypothetical protein VKT81_03390 [Bryobacteraceae bacterium]|nr:hypothetical protein [Bryobacteraceae bacterium]
MRKTSWFLFIGACTALSQEPLARPGQLFYFGYSGSNKVEIQIAVIVRPEGFSEQISAGGITSAREADGASHYIIDQAHRQYFGYDVSAENTSTAGEYRLTISPLTWTPSKEQGQLSPVLLPKYPAPQILRESDTMELVVLSSPDGKQQVVDYIQVRHKPDPPEPAALSSKSAAKDYVPDDGPIKFNFDSYAIWVNGAKYSGSTDSYWQSGATLWFYFPGEGRYLFSLIPQEGFSKAGEIRDNAIAFEAGGRQIEIITTKLIVGDSSGAWNLYSFHDPVFQAENASSLQFGVGRLKNLLPKR